MKMDIFERAIINSIVSLLLLLKLKGYEIDEIIQEVKEMHMDYLGGDD